MCLIYFSENDNDFSVVDDEQIEGTFELVIESVQPESVQPESPNTDPITESIVETEVATDTFSESQAKQASESVENQLMSLNAPNVGKENETPNVHDIQVQR